MPTIYRLLSLVFILATVGGMSVTIILVANGEKLIAVGSLLVTIFLLSKVGKCMDIAEWTEKENAKRKHEVKDL